MRPRTTRSLRLWGWMLPLALHATGLHPLEAATPATVNVTRGPLSLTLALDGVCEPARALLVTVQPRQYPGELIIDAVAANGVSVKAGDVLLQCDASKLREQIAQAERELAAARAAWALGQEERTWQTRADTLALDKAEREKQWADERLAYFQAGGQSLTKAEFESGLLDLEDAIGNQKEELEQLEAMYKSEDLALPTGEIILKRAKRSLERTQSRWHLRRQTYNRLIQTDLPHQRVQLTAEAAQRGLDWTQLQSLTPLKQAQRAADLVKLSGDVSKHERTLSRLRDDLEGFTVKSPWPGTAFHGTFAKSAWTAGDSPKPGQKIVPGTPVMTVVAADTPIVKGWLAESDWGAVRPGAAALVTPVAFPGLALAGRLTHLHPIPLKRPDGAPGFEITITLDSTNAPLKPGMRASVAIATGELKDVLWVPRSAVQHHGGVSLVHVLVSGTPVPREVTTGKSNAQRMQILSGLQAGDEVLVRP